MINAAAQRYWNASRTLLDPASDEGDALNAAVQLTLMTYGADPVLAKHAARTLDTASKLGLADFLVAQEA